MSQPQVPFPVVHAWPRASHVAGQELPGHLGFSPEFSLYGFRSQPSDPGDRAIPAIPQRDPPAQPQTVHDSPQLTTLPQCTFAGHPYGPVRRERDPGLRVRGERLFGT